MRRNSAYVGLPVAFVSEQRIGPTVLHGRTADDVARVEVVTDSGVVVESTVADGWFVAWWPGIDAIKTIRAYGDDGLLLGESDREALFG
jgi:hypothetical protein